MKGKSIKNIFVDGAVSAQKITEDIQKHATQTGIGAHSIFLGQVRADEKDGEAVTAIEYTAYNEMALQKMHAIRESLFAKYSLSCMHVYHSLGLVPVGGLCLFVFVSSQHRKDAIDACEELVEAIKFQLPIWGREIYNSKNSVWKENR